MIFTELRFFLFLGIVLSIHWMLRGAGARKWWLLAASYAFYAAWDWRFLGLIAVSTAIDFLVGRGLGATPRADRPRRRKALLGVSIAANLGLLGFFKYFGFFVDSAIALLDWFGFHANAPALRIVLPVGISFYTFQTLSYTIDVYRGHIPPLRSLRDFALFVAFFPQLVAGPIVRAAEFLPQLGAPRRWADVAVRASAGLFFCGFVKKAVVADNVAIVVDQVFASPGAHTIAEKWLGLVLYAIQAYCDFSGYSDMAIATAGLLGYRLSKNFDFPYLRTSITALWRRWHISLTTWLRDYVYFPLGGNRRGDARTYVNLLTIFLVCGLWHGASWIFVLFGLLQGAFLVAERLLAKHAGFDVERRGLHRHLYTMWAWLVGMCFFRSPDLATLGTYLGGLHWETATVAADTARIDPRWWLVAAAFFAVHAAMFHGLFRRLADRTPDPAFATALGFGFAMALPLAATAYQPFIYFQF